VAHADYFGFSLSGSNGRCLLSDLVVTHNTEVSGLNLQEANLINRGLLSLGQVIQALVKQGQTGKQVHIPYRNSRLTRLLSNSIGGNSRTFMLLSCSPSPFNLKETLSTLRFGDAMKRIKNRSIQNIELTHAELKALLAVNQQENEQLKQRVTWLENQLRRATGGAAAGDDADDDIQVGHLPVPVTPIPSATGRHSKSPSAASVTSASVVTAAAISSPPDVSRNGGTSSREDDDDREARRQERIARTQARFMQQRDAAENVELERWQREQQQQGLWTTTIEPPSPESAVSSSAASSFSSASPVSGTPRPSSAAPSLLSSPEPSSSSSSSSSLSLSPASTTSSSSSSSSSPRVLEFTSPALAAAIPTGSSPARHHSAVEQRKPLQDAELPSSLLIRPSRDRNSAADLRQLLSSFLCPLSKKVMSDPVVALDGVTYERRALLAYFAKYPSSSAAAPLVSPSTGQLLASKVVVPNVLLQRMIRQFYPEALARQRRMVQSRGILSVSAPDGEGGLDAPYLSVLPEAVLSYLAEWMDARTLCRLGQTSREMLEGVASDKRLWKLMLLRQRMHFSAADMAKADADAEGRRGGGVGGGGGGAKALYRARVLLHRPQHLQQRDKEIAEWKASGGSGTATGVYLAAPPIAAASAAAVVARMAAQGRPRTSGGATPRR
jgi:cell division septum initiation protein DivIVA